MWLQHAAPFLLHQYTLQITLEQVGARRHTHTHPEMDLREMLEGFFCNTMG